MEYVKLLYGDLVKFIVEFQNKNGVNIKYNNFLFEMGNWNTEPGFNPQSNDQFSKIVNNNKKPVNAYYKYNDKIIHYLCSITDKDVAILPVDAEKRKELMNEIFKCFFKSKDRDNIKYAKIEEYVSANDFENFMISVFDFAHFNSAEYFNTKCKKEVNVTNGDISEINGTVTEHSPTPEKNNESAYSNKEISQHPTVLPVEEYCVRKKLSTNDYNFFSTLKVTRKTILSVSYLLLGILIGVFSFSCINKNTFQFLAFASDNPKQVKTAPILQASDDTSSLGNETAVRSIKGSNKVFSENSNEAIKQHNAAQASKHSDNKNVYEKRCVPDRHSRNSDKSTPVDNYPAVESKKDSGGEKIQKEGADKKEQNNITIIGNGIYTIGDKNMVNVN